uniref:Peptidase_M13 domain-containing protein n=1 Tax=Strongyloides papillosus TaxID=174720 RepID=A0A0N5B502_STREA
MNAFILVLYTYVLFVVSRGDSNNLIIHTYGIGKQIISEKLYSETASSSLHEYVDHDVNPCDNFYKFACGKWIRTQEKKYEYHTNFSIRDGNVNFDKVVLEFQQGKYKNESKIFNNLYNLHRKCNHLPSAEIFECRTEILNFGAYALSSIFIRKNKIKSEENGDYIYVEDMIKRIKKEFRLLIDEKKHIFDEETRNNFLYKLDKMKFKRNFDEYDLSNTKEMEYCYKKFKMFFEDDFSIKLVLKNIRSIKGSLDRKNDTLDSCFGKIFNPLLLLGKYVYANAWYRKTKNFFTFNSDVLNEPSFSAYYPMSLNYGYFGATISHEITHAFDNGNYNRTLEGDNRNNFNVTQMSVKNFEEKIKCFIEQYGMQKDSITNININGLQTLPENIADNGGLKLAHRAYMKWLQSNGGKDIEVPGFEKFTKEQLFFISYGRKKCEYTSKDMLEKKIKTTRYPPPEIRTNVALSNYKPFSDAFNCPVNSKMNPEDKCELWKIQNQN